MTETSRLKIYAASREQMTAFIEEQTVDVLKAAYTEMPEGCMAHPEQWEWYAMQKMIHNNYDKTKTEQRAAPLFHIILSVYASSATSRTTYLCPSLSV